MGYFTFGKDKKRGLGRSERPDPNDLIKQAEESLRKTESQQPYVDRITSWLKNRENQNGFGEDFEYTLRPKRRHA